MSDVPAHLKYTKEHEWLELEGNMATVGITDYAQESLGDLVHVELPEVGMSLSAEEELAVVESVKSASEVYSPVSGEVVKVNEELSENPQFINTQPYADGWIAQIKISDPSELDEAMTAEEYQDYLSKLED